MLCQDKLSYLSSVRLFQSLGPAALIDLLSELDWLSLAGGETLFRTGDAGDALYAVLSGRLRIIAERSDGTTEVLREVARGETVGELALLTWAEYALLQYAIGKEGGDELYDTTELVLSDMLADVMHYARREGIHFTTCVERAAMHYEEELAEEERSAIIHKSEMAAVGLAGARKTWTSRTKSV